ncbi:sigma-54-dependent transcriptional regulator [Thermosulfuriphilus sp.]
MANESILVVDDSEAVLSSISETLLARGYEVEVARDGEEAIKKIDSRLYDVVLTDLSMPRRGGMEVLKHVRESCPETMCIIITGFGTIRNAVEAIKLGAFDYLTKPVKTDEILIVIERALEYRDLKRENQALKTQLRAQYRFDRIIGKSEKMQEVFRMIERVAATDSTVLILGESGTGKELIANAIHYASDRREGPFIPVNCGAIPDELLESELFGHEKGAFTHAIRTRIGRFELAHKGTIFLDEIAEMSPRLQVKLLRVLQDRAFERVGGVKTIKVDIRIIAATNQDLDKMVKEGKFREDLYYRLNVIPIHVPPLRERKSDIPLLVQAFLEKFSAKRGRSVMSITEEAMGCLMRYHWPGNVRELENLVERLVILCPSDTITVKDLPDYILGQVETPATSPEIEIPDEGISLSAAVSEFERKLIIQALNKTGWVKNRAAQLLRVNRTTLIEKMKKQKLYGPPKVNYRASNN